MFEIYDDGYDEISFDVAGGKDETGWVCTYKIQPGDIVSINGLLLEYDGEIFWEVKEMRFERFNKVKYLKTGKHYTAEEINKI